MCFWQTISVLQKCIWLPLCLHTMGSSVLQVILVLVILVLKLDTYLEVCESLFSGTCGMSSLFFSLYLWIAELCSSNSMLELPHNSCSRITEQICCTTISYCAVRQEFHPHTQQSHIFGLDLWAYVSEIRTATVRFVDVWDASISVCFDDF